MEEEEEEKEPEEEDDDEEEHKVKNKKGKARAAPKAKGDKAGGGGGRQRKPKQAKAAADGDEEAAGDAPAFVGSGLWLMKVGERCVLGGGEAGTAPAPPSCAATYTRCPCAQNEPTELSMDILKDKPDQTAYWDGAPRLPSHPCAHQVSAPALLSPARLWGPRHRRRARLPGAQPPAAHEDVRTPVGAGVDGSSFALPRVQRPAVRSLRNPSACSWPAAAATRPCSTTRAARCPASPAS